MARTRRSGAQAKDKDQATGPGERSDAQAPAKPKTKPGATAARMTSSKTAAAAKKPGGAAASKIKRGGSSTAEQAPSKPQAAGSSPAPRSTELGEPALRHPGGRPTLFNPKFVDQARRLTALGATDQEIADFFGVDVRTIYRWKDSADEFCQALKVGKAELDERVKRSLFWRAVGYEHDEVDIRVVNGEVVQTPLRKFYAPDTTACIFWLKNRQPREWRDKVEHEHGGTIDHSLAVKFV